MKTRIAKKIWVLALAFPMCSFAQHTLKGTVVEEHGIPLPGVNIQVANSFQKVASDEQGHFEFTNLSETEVLLTCAAPGYATQEIKALTDQPDPLKIQMINSSVTIEELVVVATRAGERTPTTYSTVTKEQLNKVNFGQDLPYLLDATPSAVTTSDAGAGVGYTGIRIRGVDPTRTNVTINGIPINDAESHGVYWVNMPDFASSVQDIQIQRGVGTSANGAAAFGASINIKTDNIVQNAYATLDNSYGSFGTMKNTVKIGTGALKNGFSLDARLSRITSDGYLDRASSDLKSFFLGGAWVGKKTTIKANLFSGKEVTYQAWEGTPESRITGDVAAMNAYADRNYLTDAQRENLLNSGRTYNLYTYDNQVDNYAQDHYQLHITHRFSSKLSANVSGHYTYGRGYYEQYKADDELSNYGLANVIVGTDTITNSDIIRRKWLDNHFYGMIYSLNYTSMKGLKLSWGGAANNYEGTHYGEVIWARYASNSSIRQRYYNDYARKGEISTYVKGSYEWHKFSFYADAQYRFIDYSYLGTSEVNGALVESQEVTTFSFFNPKAGLTYDFNNRNQVYASFAVGNREPVRDDFRQPVGGKKPTSERLNNTEIGYRYQSNKVFAKANVYYMDYTNQLILTGQLNDVGGYTRTNVKDSYRAGLELEAGYKILKNWSVSGNVTFSQNKVVAFTEYVDDYDNGGQAQIQHKNTDLAFSPNVIAALGIVYEPIKGLDISWTSKYVGKQFLDNTSDNTRKIDAYFINNVGINYMLPVKGLKELKFGVLVNNVLNYTYENNGYTFSYIYGGSTTTENFYYPQAGRNFMFRVTLGF